MYGALADSAMLAKLGYSHARIHTNAYTNTRAGTDWGRASPAMGERFARLHRAVPTRVGKRPRVAAPAPVDRPDIRVRPKGGRRSSRQ
jgi:hypothetical protein